jgi:putative component of toxin-antitoxin plasmid stabilization module
VNVGNVGELWAIGWRGVAYVRGHVGLGFALFVGNVGYIFILLEV